MYALVPLDRLDDVLRRLDHLSNQVDRLSRQLKQLETLMSKEMDDLEAAVAADTAVDQSAITLLEQISAKLAEAGTDRVKLATLAEGLKANREKLAAAVLANTPAAEPTPPAPEPTA
jgi:ABC-type transporter Mla subunit MlaD